MFHRIEGPRARRLHLGVACASALVVLAGCRTSTPTATGEATGMSGMGDHGTTSYAFGEPGDPAASSWNVDIKAHDTLKFEPASFEVNKGQTITLRVTNDGTVEHDFTLGDRATQDEHEAEMAQMAASGSPMMHDEPNMVIVGPGETKELVWTFSQPGEVIYACHSPGHYSAGMEGTIFVR